MKRLMTVAVMLVLAGCGGNGPTAPEVAVATPAPVVAAAAPTVTPEAVTAPGTYEVKWSDNASWELLNTTSETLYYTAQYTDFNDQSAVLGSRSLEAASGKVSQGSFSKSCVQVDLVSGKIFATH